MNYSEFLKQAAAGQAKPIKLKSGITQGFVKSKPLSNPVDLPKRDPLGTDYVYKYRIQEEQQQEEEESNQLEEVDGLTSIAGTLPNPDDVLGDQLTQVYEMYQFNMKQDESNLVIHTHKEEILENIESNSIVIIKGPTGCGKSTQVPQMILDNAVQSNIHCNIVVTQPRRIATVSVAKRVAKERNWGLGTIIGYQISLDKKVSTDTRLLYCTTGVLLQQLISDQSLSRYTHIIIDEVHERDMEIDFLLILVKKFLKNQSCRTKIVLMSATVDTDSFSEYFTRKVRGIVIEPPIIEMSKNLTNYTVSIYYLEHLEAGRMPMKIPEVKYDDPCISSSMMELAASLIEVFYAIDNSEHEGMFIGSVLVFLPGYNEISDMEDCLRKRKQRKTNQEDWLILPLHSNVTFDEQTSVFKPPAPNFRKIILATNIAESSITVPDVKYVIDFCLMKYQRQEPDSGYSSLQMGWMSKSQAAQRAGRVGRVMPGRVYRLIPKYLYEALPQDVEPEIKRSPLDVLVLKAKQLAQDSPPAKILAFAMDPPDLSNIRRTILTLKQLGGLSSFVNGEYVEDDGELTFIGQVMASLPIDIALSKLIIMGHTFSLLTDAIVIACSMAVRNVFSSPFKKHLEAYNSKIAWSDSSCSDPIAFRIVYDVWRRKTTDGSFARSAGMKDKQFAENYFVQIKALREVSLLENEITNRLRKLNIVEPLRPVVKWNDMEKPLVLKIMIAGAFYPNYFVRRPIDEKEAVKIIGGRDPFNTCYLKGFPFDQPGPLYAESIKNYFTHCGSDIHISFDGSSKVYLEFKNSASDIDTGNKPALMPGCIQMALYRAIKLRQLKRVISIPLLPPHDAKARWSTVSRSGEGVNPDSVFNKKETSKVQSHLPGCTTEILAVNISHKESPSKFWVQIADEAFIQRLAYIFHLLNDGSKHSLIPLKKKLQIGMLVAAPFSENGRKSGNVNYFRGRIKNFGVGNSVQVFFIDYGNTEWINSKDLMDFHQQLIDLNITEDPEIAMECTLTEVQPSAMSNRNGLWSQNAVSEFDKYFAQYSEPMAIAKIFSVVNRVVSVILFRVLKPGEELSFENSFNQHLITNGFADRCEEPYLSRESHLLRETAMKRPDLAQAFMLNNDNSGEYVKSPKESECINKVVLKGPFSPLEMQLWCMTQKSLSKNVRIDPASVNSVLLDPYPMDPHERMLVAGLVNQNPSGENLILRQTTLMPNIHGLLAIIALVFSPNTELRVDSERTRWTGALCGLGADPVTHNAYDPENDMEVIFDVAFTIEDLENINKLRYWMNHMVFGGLDWRKEMCKVDIVEAQKRIKVLLTKILLRKRKSHGVTHPVENYKWGSVDDKWLLSPMEDGEALRPSLYPLIWAVRLKKSSTIAGIEIRNTLDKLQDIIRGVEQLRATTTCDLCHVDLDDVQAVKFHVNSSMHREALFEYRKNVTSN